MRRHAAVLGTFFLFASAVLAATNPAGVWEGSIPTPNGDLGFVFNLHRDGDKWAAEMDVPSQGVTGLPIADVKVDGGAVSFPIPGPGDPHYDGKLSADGKTIAGTFSQGSSSLPLDLKWKSEPRAVEKAPANVGDVQALDGVWEGVLDTGGTSLHVRFNFTKGDDGSEKATLDVEEQKLTGLGFTSIARTGDTVKLDLKVIHGGFEGKLNKDLTTMTGTWSQGPGNLPLTVTRKPAEKKDEKKP
jgi:hypothetical protein